jgi:hypothetical protein
LRSLLLPTIVAFTVVCVVACSPESEPAGSTTPRGGATTLGSLASGETGELVHASVLLQGDLDTGARELPLIVTYGDCIGGLVPQEVESVELVETKETVTIAVFVRLPPAPYPTTCPGNPEIEYTIILDSPLGARTVEVESGDETYLLWPIDA